MSLFKRSFKLSKDTQLDCWIFMITDKDGNESFWFKGNDVSTFLKHRSKNVIRRLKPEWKKSWRDLKMSIADPRTELPTHWDPSTTFISELALHWLIFTSERPEVEIREKWVQEISRVLRKEQQTDQKPMLPKQSLELLEGFKFDCYMLETIDEDGNEYIWFKGEDVAAFLGPDNTIIDSVKPDWKMNWKEMERLFNYNTFDLPSDWDPHSVFVSEDGLYSLILSSAKPEAKRFVNGMCKALPNFSEMSKDEKVETIVNFRKMHV